MTTIATTVTETNVTPVRTAAELASIARFQARGVAMGDKLNLGYHRTAALVSGIGQSATRGLTDGDRAAVELAALAIINAKRNK